MIKEERPYLFKELVKILIAWGAAPVISITAGRYIAVSSTSGIFDAIAGVWIDNPPKTWFETRIFNVRELMKFCITRVEKARKLKDQK